MYVVFHCNNYSEWMPQFVTDSLNEAKGYGDEVFAGQEWEWCRPDRVTIISAVSGKVFERERGADWRVAGELRCGPEVEDES